MFRLLVASAILFGATSAGAQEPLRSKQLPIGKSTGDTLFEQIDPARPLRNLQKMVTAAQSLERSMFADGYTYMLVKQGTVRSPVAIMFGYLDNAVACEEIADILNEAETAGTFKCHPIF